ncbi:ABC transporter permease [Winogradskyella psychrotolerans]|uniref:ABC transporter permease n=1 Tax=Winogradskyella psychrotolerans TaxID=1344585 RepID=UPI001C071A48|nr:ABC transporter permease [Winogradskyella psychrotolerans]MBU2920703.1 ABC transporter permease [Winogradskyella psychrotolerans]
MEKLRSLFAVKKEKLEDEDLSFDTKNQDNIRITYYQSGFAAAQKASGKPIVLKACLQNVYNSFEDQCRNQKIEQEKLKKPYYEEIERHNSEIKKLETAKEINEEKQVECKNQLSQIKEDIIDVRVNPDNHGLIIERNPKVKFYIGLALLLPITLYLLVFYISASYSVFFKEFNDDSLSSAIFDAQAFTKAMQDGALEAILIVTIPFVFMGLGYIIHMMQKVSGIASKIKLFLLFVVTFLFDGLLAYVIEKKIYEFNRTPSSPDFDLSIAVKESEFWVIIFAGFIVYIIWGLVFDFVMKEHESLDKINVFINAKKKEMANIRTQLKELVLKNDSLKSKITEFKGKASEAQSKIDGFIFPIKKYLHYHHQYVEGWFQSIGTEIALPKKQKDELLEDCQTVCNEHLIKLNLNEDSTQNTIYSKS